MPDSHEEVNKYLVVYFGGGGRRAEKYFEAPRAYIELLGDDGTSVGQVRFWPNSNAAPDTDERTPSGFIICNVTSEEHPDVLDLLRNEKPMYIHYLDDPYRLALLSTSWELPEPVGEGEVP